MVNDRIKLPAREPRGRRRAATVDGGKAANRKNRPVLEFLDDRIFPAVDITAFNVAVGSITFTGDRGSKVDSLQLSETVVGPDVFLSHNLISAGGTGNYADSRDIDPGAGIQRIKVGTGSSPLLTVSLGSNRDTLTLANSWSFGHKINYNAGSGADTLRGPAAALTWNITGTSGTSYSGNIIDTSKLTFSTLETIGGGSATDTLVGLNANSTWSLAASQSYKGGPGTLKISGFEVLQGGTANDSFSITANSTAVVKGGGGTDSFTFSSGRTLTGSIDGEAGSDTLRFDAYTTSVSTALSSGSADGFTGTTTGVSAGFSGIDTFLGGNGSDTLTGANLASTWGLDDTPTYTASGFTFNYSGFETLQGGSSTDTFSLLGDGLLLVTPDLRGGGGSDAFDFSDGVYVTGDIDGEAGSDTLNYSAYNSGIVATLTSPATADGYAGTELLGIGGNFSGIDVLTGSSDIDYLTGEDANSTWTFDTVRTYKDDSVANSLTYSSIESIQGGSQADLFDIAVDPGLDLYGGAGSDTFKFRNGVTSSFSLFGESGTDSLDLTLYTTNRNVALSAVFANGFSGTDGVSAGFIDIDTVRGGTGTNNSLTGLTTGTWNLNTTQTYVSGGGTLTFSSFKSLQGGSGTDTYNVLTSTTADLSGNNGNDSFVFSNGAVLTGTATGGTGTDTLDATAYTTNVTATLSAVSGSGFTGSGTVASSFVAIDTIRGGTGSNNSLTGLTTGTWNLNTTQTYVSGGGTLTFSSFKSLQGGSGTDTYNVLTSTTADLSGNNGNDSFVFSNGAVLTGTATGGTGTDTLDMTAYTTNVTATLSAVSASGFMGSGTVASSFVAIDTVRGGTGTNNTLTGLTTGTWNLNTTQTYVSGGGTLTFSSFKSLQGGSGTDTYNVLTSTTADLSGNNGNDSFVFSNGAVLTGTATGGTGTDTLDATAYTTNVTATLSAVSGSGFTGSGTVASSFVAIDTVRGGTGANNSLTGLTTGTWNLNTTQTYVSGGGTLTFSSFKSLQGGSGTDTYNVLTSTTADLSGNNGNDSFVFSNGAVLTGTATGGTGTDTLDATAYTTNVTATLLSSTVSGFTGTSTGVTSFAAIDTILAGSGPNNTLIGEDVPSTWTVDNAGSTYHDGSFAFSLATFQSYQGGSAADSFNVTSNTTATLLGGNGPDSFVLSDGVTLSGSVDGGLGSDTLSLAAYTAYSFVTLTSSSATTGFAGDSSGLTAGFLGVNVVAAGTDAFDILMGLDVAANWMLDSTQSYADGSSSLAFSGFEILQGGLEEDTFDISSNITADLYGGEGDDQFNLAIDGVELDGVIDGEDGSDTLDYSAYTSPITLDLSALSATGTGGVAGLEDLIGGTGENTLIADNQDNSWIITGSNAGSLTGESVLTFSSIANLTGGALDDAFVFNDGVGITGTLDGGGGSDTLDFSAFSAPNGLTVDISSNNGGSVGGPGIAFGFSSAENLAGGSGNDTFALGAGRSLAGTISGGSGNDTLDYSAYTTTVRANLTTGAAIGIKASTPGSISGIENLAGGTGNDFLLGDSASNILIGGGGNDVLVGNDGSDYLLGEAGRDIAIGGNGADSIDGGDGDDLLIAGRTTYDNTLADLVALMSEWSRTDATYATRISHLNGTLAGGRNGSRLLNISTIFDDSGAVDTLTGGADLDWFIDFLNDLITDLHNGGTETHTRL